MNAPPPRFPEILEAFRSIVETQLLAHNVAPQSASQIADACAMQVRLDWGGQQVYIPKMTQSEIEKRNRLIAGAFNGYNALDLCRQHGLSFITLRRILAAARPKAAPGDGEEPIIPTTSQ